MGRLVGIDLGTSYSSLAALNEAGQAEVIPNRENELATPSVVSFDEDEILIGTPALERASIAPERTVQNAKRFLHPQAPGWEIDGMLYMPVDIAAFILNKVKQDAETQIGPISRAVISVPVHFDAFQRQLTIEAARRAKLEVISLINEPVAAALSFILGKDAFLEEMGLISERLVLVSDLGGGTFDLSLVKYSPESIRVLASGGDLRLGGIDWTDALLHRTAETWRIMPGGFDPATSLRIWQEMVQKVEAGKRILSEPGSPQTTFSVGSGRRKTDFELNRQDFEELTSSLVKRMELRTQQLVRSSGYLWDDIHSVVLVGGASRMPMIQKMMRRISGRTPQPGLSPDYAVVEGAAVYAGLLSQGKGRDPTRPGHLIGSSPRSLGILVRDEDHQLQAHVVIPRNTPLPATANFCVTTVKANQPRIRLKIIEADETEHFPLGSCVIEDLPPHIPANSVFDVAFEYQTDGVLQVMARHQASGLFANAMLIPDK